MQKKIQSVIWMDERALAEGRQARRNFKSLYLFSDGFASREELAARIDELGFSQASFLHLQFCSTWYAIALESYLRHTIVAKEKVYFQKEAFGELKAADPDVFDAGSIILPDRPVQDTKKWQDGICRDLKMADPDLELFSPGGKKYGEDRVLWNNALITFGLGCFVREIKIATNSYVEHVFSNYYSDRSLSYMYADIQRLREEDYTYFNPFLQTASRTESERNKKGKALLGGIEVPPVIKKGGDPAGSKTDAGKGSFSDKDIRLQQQEFLEKVKRKDFTP